MRRCLVLGLVLLLGPAGCSIRDGTFTGLGGGDDAPPGGTQIVASTAALEIAEGLTGSFTVALAGDAPTSDVTVAIRAIGGLVGVSPATLVFRPGEQALPQPVMVTTTADADLQFALDTVELTAAGLESQTTGVRVLEPDAIELTPLMGTGCPGDSVEAAVHLKGDPGWPLEVTAAIAGGASIDPATFTFDATNYAVFQAGTVTAGGGPATVFVQFGSPGLTTKQFRLTIRDPGAPICIQ